MITVNNVSHTFTTRRGKSSQHVDVLQGIDLQLNSGGFVAFIGPSGCGKTTLLRMIDGLILPQQGRIAIDGEPVTEPSQKCAMVFQEFNLFPWRSVLDNVGFPLEMMKVSKEERQERCLQAIHRVGLDQAAGSFPHELSGGMKQRVGLARALVCERPYLLMDEPFGALDPQIRELLQIDLLKTLEPTDATVVFVTHDLNEAILLADRIVTFSARPARVINELDIDIPRPRAEHAEEIRESSAFSTYRREIWNLLIPEVDTRA